MFPGRRWSEPFHSGQEHCWSGGQVTDSQRRQMGCPTSNVDMADMSAADTGSKTLLSARDLTSWARIDARWSELRRADHGACQHTCQQNEPNEAQCSMYPQCGHEMSPWSSTELSFLDKDTNFDSDHTRISPKQKSEDPDVLGHLSEQIKSSLAGYNSSDSQWILLHVFYLLKSNFVVHAAEKDPPLSGTDTSNGQLSSHLTGENLNANIVTGHGAINTGVSVRRRGQIFLRSSHPHINGNGEHFHHEEHHINQKVSNRHKILTSLMAGGLAGAIAKTTIAPLDRTKINFQTSDQKFSPRRAVEFIKRVYQTEGFRALWRGNSATMVRVVPYAAIQYSAHEQYKLLFNKGSNKKHLPPVRRAMAGSLAGITATSLTYPLDFARARMAVTAKERYGNLLIVFRTVWREEGWRIFMKGYTPTVLGSCIYSGISFFTYETLKKEHASYSMGVDPTPFTRWCFGACAGILGQCTSYPLDIVRRRMQTAGVTGHSADYTTILRTALSVYRSEGLKGGLYKGLSMNWIKGPISAGISFMVFETVQRWLRKFPVFHIDE